MMPLVRWLEDATLLNEIRSFMGDDGPRVSPQRPRWFRPAVLLAVWALPGLLYSAQIFQVGRAVEPDFPFILAVLHALPVWWFWAVLTPLVVYLARKVPIGRENVLVGGATHLLGSVTIALIAIVFAAFWFGITPAFPGRDRSFLEWLWTLAHALTFHVNVFAYWLILGAVHLLDYERRLREHEVMATRREVMVARARMQVLARQLRPHFLFNSLNALSTLILRRDDPAALGMLSSLTDFLQATSRVETREMQPLREEIDLVRQYLAVEQVRLGRQLEVLVDCDEMVLDQMVPVLFLQPIVENAIRHGAAAREEGGQIAIRATAAGDAVLIEIENDGPGLSPDWQTRMEDRVGLSNTRARLLEAFGGDGLITLEQVATCRVRARIIVPTTMRTPIDTNSSVDEVREAPIACTPLEDGSPPARLHSAEIARGFTIALVFAAWTLPGLIYAVQLYEIGRRAEPEFSFSTALLAALLAWWIWVPLTPLVARLARRIRIRRERTSAQIAAHLAISLGVAALVVVGQALIKVVGPGIPGIALDLREWLFSSFFSTAYHLNVFAYWLIVGVVHVIDYEARLKDHELKAVRREAVVARARTQVLARQLQPLFLFNSLNSLADLVVRGGTDRALAMLGSLAGFLRATLRVGDHTMHTLREELALVEKYLEVEKVRLNGRPEVLMAIEEGVLEQVVPVLFLQPIVEGAVRFGVAGRDTGGRFALTARRQGQQVSVEIEVDGPEPPSDWFARWGEQVHSGNSREQLRAAFGASTEILVENAGSGRARFQLTLPVVTSEATPGMEAADLWGLEEVVP